MSGAEAFTASGHGPRARLGIVLVHGFTGSPITMRPLADRLAARGYTIELPRLPGHGTDPLDMAQTSYPDWRAEVLSAIDHLPSDLSHRFLVGLSMGGTLVLDVASSGERPISGVVAINAQILDRGGIMPRLAPIVARLVPFVPARVAGMRKNDIAKPGVSELGYDRIPVLSGVSLTRALKPLRDRLPRIDCPILVAYSPQDHSVPPENSLFVLNSVKSPDVTKLILERSYHVATLDYDLEILDERITAFCDRVGGLPSESQKTPG